MNANPGQYVKQCAVPGLKNNTMKQPIVTASSERSQKYFALCKLKGCLEQGPAIFEGDQVSNCSQ